ncbi:MAG: septum formation protein Maf [Proteobacteria bacterium]|nr:septum formation protein Maf [Pseudomonadota bacterium]
MLKHRITHLVPLILASTSEGRRAQLTRAGLTFDCMQPLTDEEDVKPTIAHLPLDQQALALARVKGEALSAAHPDKVVISGDQICALGDEILHKPLTNDRAAQQLAHMSGKTHQLYTGGCLFRGGKVIWEDVTITSLHMRELYQQEIDRYVLLEDVRFSSASYKIEGLGLHLMERIDGDTNAIMGLPLVGILNALHSHKLIKIG